MRKLCSGGESRGAPCARPRTRVEPWALLRSFVSEGPRGASLQCGARLGNTEGAGAPCPRRGPRRPRTESRAFLPRVETTSAQGEKHGDLRGSARGREFRSIRRSRRSSKAYESLSHRPAAGVTQGPHLSVTSSPDDEPTEVRGGERDGLVGTRRGYGLAMRAIFGLVLGLAILPACSQRGFGAAMSATGAVLDTVVVIEMEREASAAASRDARDQEIDEARSYTPRPDVYVVPKASARDTVPVEERRAFDPVKVRQAFGAVDFEVCRANGLRDVRGHATMTLAPTGNVSKVVIDKPAALSPSAVACIGRQLGDVRVSAFDGAPVRVATSFHVR